MGGPGENAVAAGDGRRPSHGPAVGDVLGLQRGQEQEVDKGIEKEKAAVQQQQQQKEEEVQSQQRITIMGMDFGPML